jgi:hypothetical protein
MFNTLAKSTTQLKAFKLALEGAVENNNYSGKL